MKQRTMNQWTDRNKVRPAKNNYKQFNFCSILIQLVQNTSNANADLYCHRNGRSLERWIVGYGAIWLLNAVARTKPVTEYSIKVIAYSCSQIFPASAKAGLDTAPQLQPQDVCFWSFCRWPLFLRYRRRNGPISI